MTLNKTWAHSPATGFSLSGIFSKLRNAVRIEIPVGYQDETGFHYGVKASDKSMKGASHL